MADMFLQFPVKALVDLLNKERKMFKVRRLFLLYLKTFWVQFDLLTRWAVLQMAE